MPHVGSERASRAGLSSVAHAPSAREWSDVQARARKCTACDLYAHATQTVFGAGAVPSPLMLIGEQPGDQEDLQGAPFVGPAGQMLDRALREIGLDRRKVYVTNAVKHFKWQPRGKRRLHKKPANYEIAACRRWLDAELELVQPDLIVTLGATAGAALLGKTFKVTQQRGRLIEDGGLRILPTIHPSMILRVPGEAARQLAYREFTRDLKKIFELLGQAEQRLVVSEE